MTRAYTSSGVHCGNGLGLFKSPWVELNLPQENPSAIRAGSEFAQAGAFLSQESILLTILHTQLFPAEGRMGLRSSSEHIQATLGKLAPIIGLSRSWWNFSRGLVKDSVEAHEKDWQSQLP